MRIKIYVIYAILYIVLHINPLIAQRDSCKAEIGLDFLVGRIVGGIGAGIHYDKSRQHFKSERSPDTNYEGYRPEILLAKANLLSLSLVDYSNRAITGSYKNWSHLPEIQIRYRSEKSLQFYFENTYLLRDYDYKQKTDSTFIGVNTNTNKNSTISFGFQYLSNNGVIGYKENLSKWLYYLMRRPIQYTSEKMLPVLFLDANQFYIELLGTYGSSKLRTSREMEGHFSTRYIFDTSSSYLSNRSLNYKALIYYNLMGKLSIMQKLAYNNRNDFRDIFSERYSDDFLIERKDIRNSNHNSDVNNIDYELNISLFAHKNLFNQFFYALEKRDGEYYSKSIYQRDSLSAYWGYGEFQKRSQNIGVAFNYLKVEQPISLPKILSDYDNYYGHLLPTRGIKWTSVLLFSQYEQEGDSRSDAVNTSHVRNRKDSMQSMELNQIFSYGISQNINFNFELSINRQIEWSSSHSEYSNFTSEYYHQTRLKAKLGIGYYNYRFDNAAMNWSTISEFNYWQGPLLNDGMFRITVNYIPPDFKSSLASKEKKYLEFNWRKLISSRNNRLILAFDIGIPMNIELGMETTLSRWDYNSFYKDWFHKNNRHELSSDIGLKWQFMNSARISVQYFIRYPDIKNGHKYEDKLKLGLVALF